MPLQVFYKRRVILQAMRNDELKNIARLIKSAVMVGTEGYLKKYRYLRINKAAAYRIYGRANVDRWIKEALIIPDGKFLNRDLPAQVAARRNRVTYLDSNDRHG